jgi:hypothetical protein
LENKSVYELIVEALEEANILECARDQYESDHMLYVAQRLSGAPFSLVEEIFTRKMVDI